LKRRIAAGLELEGERLWISKNKELKLKLKYLEHDRRLYRAALGRKIKRIFLKICKPRRGGGVCPRR
jgi:hypothetical protein